MGRSYLHLYPRLLAILCLILSVLPTLSDAQEEPILVVNRAVNGLVDVTEFSREDLLRLPQHTLVTENEFVDGPTTFVGPLGRDVLDTVGRGTQDSVTLTAANDFQIDVPISDLDTYDVVFALSADGEDLSPRDKGPIWVIYPMSQHKELQDPVFNSRLIWQLVQMDIK